MVQSGPAPPAHVASQVSTNDSRLLRQALEFANARPDSRQVGRRKFTQFQA